MVDGWLFKFVCERQSDHRLATNWWASWLSDENKALACIKDHVGDCKVSEATMLTEQELRLMGLHRPGEVKHVRSEF
jgi:hypothetical protein